MIDQENTQTKYYENLNFDTVKFVKNPNLTLRGGGSGCSQPSQPVQLNINPGQIDGEPQQRPQNSPLTNRSYLQSEEERVKRPSIGEKFKQYFQCCGSREEQQQPIQFKELKQHFQTPIPEDFFSDLEEQIQKIIQKAPLAGDKSQKEEIFLTLQWFIVMKQNLNELTMNELIAASYDLIIKYLPELLRSCGVYLRQSNFLCIQVLQICNDFARVLCSFFLKNDQHQMSEKLKRSLNDQVQELENQIPSDSQPVFQQEIEFEVQVLKAAIQNFSTDSNEKRDIFFSSCKALVGALLLSSSIDEDLKALVKGAKFLITAYQTSNLKEKYNAYYYFESLKWSIIKQLVNGKIEPVMEQLKHHYKRKIEDKKDWFLNCCWIKMMTFLIQYRPIVCKQDLPSKQSCDNDLSALINAKYIRPLSFQKKNSGRLMLFQDQQQQEKVNEQLSDFVSQKGQAFQTFLQKLLETMTFSEKFFFQFQDQPNVNGKLDFISLQLEKFETINIGLRSELERVKSQILDPNKPFLESLKLKGGNDEVWDPEISINNIFILLAKFNKMQLQMELQLDNVNFIYDSLQQVKGGNNEKFNEKLQLTYINLQSKQVTISKLYSDLEKKKVECLTSIIQLAFRYEGTTKKEQQIQYLDDKSKETFRGDEDSVDKKNIEDFMSSCEKLRSEFLDVIAEYESINSDPEFKYKKEQTPQFCLKKPLEKAERIIIKIVLDLNPIERSIQSINKIRTEKQEEIRIKKEKMKQEKNDKNEKNFKNEFLNDLISYMVLHQLLKNLGTEMNNYLDTLNQVHKFISAHFSTLKQNKGLIDDVEENNEAITQEEKINRMMKKQYDNIVRFFENEEVRRQNNKGVDTDQVVALKKLLQNDVDYLKTNKENAQQNFTAMFAKRQIEGYEKTPQRLSNLKKQVLEMYDKLVPKAPNEQEKTKQPQEVKKEECREQQEQQNGKIIKTEENKLDTQGNNNQKNDENEKTDQNELESTIGKMILNFSNLQLLCETTVDIQSYTIDQNQNIWNTLQEYDDSDNFTQFIQPMFENEKEGESKFFQHLEKRTKIKVKLTKQDEFKSSTDQIEILLQFIDQVKEKQLNLIEEDMGMLKTTYNQVKQQIKDLQDDDNYKVRQCFIYSLLQLQYSGLEQNIVKYSQDRLLQVWGTEKDQRVKELLKNPDALEIQKKLFESDLLSCQERLKLEMQRKLKQMKDSENEFNQAKSTRERQEIQKKLEQQQKDFDDFLENIKDMAGNLQINTLFLKEIYQDLNEIKTQINKLSEGLNNIGLDIRKLRGKNYNELLDIRQEKVIQQKQLTDLQKIYIRLKVQEWNPDTGKKFETTSFLFQDKFIDETGEVNELLQANKYQKDVMLLRGVAGSGKSRSAAKIEEFLWENRKNSESTWIPIYVSLPSLKEPKFNLIDQVLESESYQFDKIQIREFKTALAEQKLKIVLILDSYDEMKEDCIQSNLYQTNGFKDLCGNAANKSNFKEYFKVIITTRQEILSESRYQTWFYGESLSSLKEVEILGFDDQQQQEYLYEFSFLSVKKELYELYEFLKQEAKEKISLQEFTEFSQQVLKDLKKKQQQSSHERETLIGKKQVQEIMKQVQKEKCYRNINIEQSTDMEKKLQELWSAKKYQKLITNVNISHILKTPFMMEIVVQVLPNMITKYSDHSIYKDKFIERFAQINQQLQTEKGLIHKYIKERKIHTSEHENQLIQLDQIAGDNEFKKMGKEKWEQLDKNGYFKTCTAIDTISKAKLKDIYNQNLRIVIRALVVKTFTVYDFYFSFVEFYHSRQIAKLQELGRVCNYESLMIDLFAFSQSLAINLTMNQLTQIKSQSKGQLSLGSKKNNDEEWQDVYFNDFIGNGEYKKLIRSCILLSQKGNNHSFTHKSIQEFYIAEYMLKVFNETNIVNENDFISITKSYCWKDKKLSLTNQSDQNESNLSDQATIWVIQQICFDMSNQSFNKNEFNISKDNYKGAIDLLKDEMKQCFRLKDKLIVLVKLSQISSEFRRAASNSIFLLGINNEYLGNQQLQNIQISDTNIFGLSFYKSDLSQSSFNNVGISGCNFNNANLQNIKWVNVVCNESPMLNEMPDNKQDQNNFLQTMAFSRNSKFFAEQRGNIFTLWDITTGTQHLITKDQWKARKVYFIEDDCFVLSTKGKKIQLWDVIKNESLWKFDGDVEDCITMDLSSNRELFACLIQQHEVKIYKVKKIEKQLEFLADLKATFIVNNFFFSPNSKTLAISGNNKIELLETIKFSRIFQSLFKEMSVSSDGLLFAIRHLSDQIQTYDLQTLTYVNFEATSIKKGAYFTYSLDGKNLAQNFENEVELWIDKNKIKFNLPNQDKINNMRFSPDNTVLVLSYENKKVRIFDIAQKKYLAFGNSKDLYESLIISKGGTLIALNSQHEMIFWDLKGDKVQATLKGDSGIISQILLSPDEKILVTYSKDRIKLWDMKKVDLIESFETEPDLSQEIAFSPNGNLLAICIKDKVICLLDVKDNSRRTDLEILEKPCVLLFSSDSLIIASQSISDIKLWNVTTAKLLLNYKLDVGKIFSIAFSPDSKILAFQDRGEIVLWNIQQAKKEAYFKPVIEDQQKIFFSPDGSILVVHDTKNNVCLWDVKASKLLDLTVKDKIIKVSKIFFFQNNKYLVTVGDDKNIRLWDVQTRKQLTEFIIDLLDITQVDNTLLLHKNNGGLQKWVIENDKFSSFTFISDSLFSSSRLIFSQDSKMLALCEGNSIQYWNAKSGLKEHDFQGKNEFCQPIFSPDGSFLATQSKDSTIVLWNTIDKLLKATLNDPELKKSSQLLFSSNNQILASTNGDKVIRIWSTKLAIQVAIFECTSKIISMLFTPDGQTLAVNNEDNTISLWNAKSGKVRQRDGHENEITQIIFSPDGSILASYSRDNTIKLWNPEDGKLSETFEASSENENCLVFSPDGQRLAFCCNGFIKLWDKITKIVTTLEQKYTKIIQLLFSHSSNELASFSENEVLLWDLDSEQNTPFKGSDANAKLPFKYIAFLPNDDILALQGTNIITHFQRSKEYRVQSVTVDDPNLTQQTIKLIFFSLEHALIIFEGAEQKLLLWNVARMEKVRWSNDFKSPITQLAYSPDNQSFAVCLADKQILLLMIPSFEQIAHYQHPNPNATEKITHIVYSPNGQILASSSSSGLITFLNVQQRREIAIIKGHSESVNCISFSPNGLILASCSKDKSIRLWEISPDFYQLTGKDQEQTTKIEKYLLCFQIVARNQLISAINCDITGGEITTDSGCNLKLLFIQKKAIHNEILGKQQQQLKEQEEEVHQPQTQQQIKFANHNPSTCCSLF